MRTIHTFILRLMVDTDDPRTLRGSIQAIEEDTTHIFTNASSLLALLRKMLAAAAQGSPDPEGE